MKKIIFALLIFTSCAVKKPSVEQIKKLNYNDLPNYKQNEFGKEWYKDNPCATAFGTIGRDTITSIVYDYSALRALEDSINLLQTNTITYLNNNKEISTKYNECNEVLSKCIKNLIEAKKTGFKNQNDSNNRHFIRCKVKQYTKRRNNQFKPNKCTTKYSDSKIRK